MLRAATVAVAISLLAQSAFAAPTPYFRYGTADLPVASVPDVDGNAPPPSVPSGLRITLPADGSTRVAGVSETVTLQATAVGISGDLTWTATGPDGKGTPWPAGSSVTPQGAVTIVPDMAGDTSLRLYATESGTGATTSVSFTVKASTGFTVHQDDQVFRSAGVLTAASRPTVANAKGTLRWTMTNQPDWVQTFDPGSGWFRGTVPVGPLPDVIATLTAVDQSTGERASTTFKIKVGDPLRLSYSPVITTAYGSGPVFAVAGQPLRLTPTVSGAKGKLSWNPSELGLPPGLSLDPVTGVISGTPLYPAYVSGYRAAGWAYYYYHAIATDLDGVQVYFGFSNQTSAPVAAATVGGVPVDLSVLSDNNPATTLDMRAGSVLQVRTSSAFNAVTLLSNGSGIGCWSYSRDGLAWTSEACSNIGQYVTFADPLFNHIRLRAADALSLKEMAFVRY